MPSIYDEAVRRLVENLAARRVPGVRGPRPLPPGQRAAESLQVEDPTFYEFVEYQRALERERENAPYEVKLDELDMVDADIYERGPYQPPPEIQDMYGEYTPAQMVDAYQRQLTQPNLWWWMTRPGSGNKMPLPEPSAGGSSGSWLTGGGQPRQPRRLTPFPARLAPTGYGSAITGYKS